MAVSRPVTEQPPRLMVHRALGLGDLLTALPALRGLRRGHPAHEMVVATPPALHPLLFLAGCADVALPAAGLTPPAWPKDPPDLAVNLHGSGPQSHELLRGLRPARMVAYRCDRAGWESGPRWREDEHEVDRWARLVEESLGLPVDRDDLGLAVTYEQMPSEVRPGLALLHPGGTDPRRRWPAGRFGGVASALSRAGCQIAVTGTAREAGLAEAVVRSGGLPTAANLAGSLDLAALTGLVSAADVVVSGDTGVGHLATAVGTPSVLLFGPAPPDRWGPPPGRSEHQVVHEAGIAARDLDIAPTEVAELALEVRRRQPSHRASGGRVHAQTT